MSGRKTKIVRFYLVTHISGCNQSRCETGMWTHHLMLDRQARACPASRRSLIWAYHWSLQNVQLHPPLQAVVAKQATNRDSVNLHECAGAECVQAAIQTHPTNIQCIKINTPLYHIVGFRHTQFSIRVLPFLLLCRK